MDAISTINEFVWWVSAFIHRICVLSQCCSKVQTVFWSRWGLSSINTQENVAWTGTLPTSDVSPINVQNSWRNEATSQAACFLSFIQSSRPNRSIGRLWILQSEVGMTTDLKSSLKECYWPTFQPVSPMPWTLLIFYSSAFHPSSLSCHRN